MKSNINSVILRILNDEMEIKENEKNYILDALNLEYDNSDKERPHLNKDYLKFVEEYSD
ncbi:hypothetical protein [uncultured Methanobrevibacter sp.]|uniref:hypothetical protein n=1 Tax=uncultured Methanobrevibacter sp. TaxID=253161 RepID=UPI0025E9DBF6|nr:hypothetical protein [uncultured Methanobrevibacter sp.]